MDVVEVVEKFNEPICKLIDAIKDAIGTAYEPHHIRKMADAKAYEINAISETIKNNCDLPIIYNKSDISINSTNYEDIIKRAGLRLAYQEVAKQENIENIFNNAFDELQGVSSCESRDSIEKDWMLRFINSIEDISNSDLQILWGKILSGEIIRPNSISLRTLDILKNISIREANLFEKICPYIIDGVFITAEIEILNKCGIAYSDIILLDDCGLMSSSMVGKSVHMNNECNILLSNEKYVLLVKQKEGTKRDKILINVYSLSEAGKNLYNIVNCINNNNDYFLDVLKKIKEINTNYFICSIHEVISNNDEMVEYEEDELQL